MTYLTRLFKQNVYIHLRRVVVITLLSWQIPYGLYSNGIEAVSIFGGCSTLPNSAYAGSNRVKALKDDLPDLPFINEAYGKLPLAFEPNLGQADRRAKFVARGAGFLLYLTPTQVVCALPVAQVEKAQCQNSVSSVKSKTELRMTLGGANAEAPAIGVDELACKSNYFIGKDPNHWRTDVPNYSGVKYQNIYPGVDVIYYGNRRQLEYDFALAPGANPADIRLVFEGARKIRINHQGDLVLETASGDVYHRKPLVYQRVDGIKKEIEGRYSLKKVNEAGFEIPAYDKSKPLIIDPVLAYSTYLGGRGEDTGYAISVDSAGNAFVTGATYSEDFPTTPGALQTKGTAFVSKLNTSGTALLYSTYIGGSSSEAGFGITVDGSGNAYVTGYTNSSDFPVTQDAFQTDYALGSDAFVTKLNPSGSTLLYSTYLGGNFNDAGLAITVDSRGSAYVTGSTSSKDFPTKNPLPSSLTSNFSVEGDARFRPRTTLAPATLPFVTKLNATGAALVYSTYLYQGSQLGSLDGGSGIAVDAAGNAYVAGATSTKNFPVTAGAFQKHFGGEVDGFVVKLNSRGDSLIYSTYLGGGGPDGCGAIALDSAGNVYVTGSTNSSTFPTTAGAFQPANGDSASFKSTDGGITWKAINAGLSDTTVKALAIDPLNPSTLYAGTSRLTFGGSVFKSTNGGADWSASVGLPDSIVNVIAVDPKNPSIVYAGTGFNFFGGGLFKSTDGGDSWSGSGLPQFPIDVLFIDPLTPSTIYVGAAGGIYKSTDGGMSGRLLQTGPTLNASGTLLAIDTQSPATLYVGTNAGVRKSTDGGDSWSDANFKLPVGGYVGLLAIDPKNSSILYARTSDGLLSKSTDGGGSWVAAGQVDSFISFLVFDPQTPSTLYAVTYEGIFKSTDGGDSWSKLMLTQTGINALVIDHKNPATLYVGARSSADAFVTKLNPAGSGLVYSTYLGGVADDDGYGIAIDSSGAAFITGASHSINFPITRDALQVSLSGSDTQEPDAFIARLNPAGTALVYSTYLGGEGDDSGKKIAVDSSGNAYVTGYTQSKNFLTTQDSFQRVASGERDAFIIKIRMLAPKITGATIKGKKLVVTGEGFDKGAAILVNGQKQKTSTDNTSTPMTLTSKSAGKKIAPGQPVIIQVRNADGVLSQEFAFIRSGE